MLPCNLDVGFPNFPRIANEGLACYFSRYIEAQQTGPVGPEGPQGEPGNQGEPSVSVKAFDPANQSIPNNVATALTFTAESFDTNGMHDNVVNNSRLTVTIAGKYIIQGQITFNTSSGGAKRVEIRKNGTTVVATFKERIDDGTDTPELSIIQVHDLEEFIVGDFVELLAFQDSGGPIDAVGQSNFTWFGMTRHADMGEAGPAGPTGPAGAAGAVGPVGPAGPAGGGAVLSAQFTSADQVITAGGGLTLAHGLGGMPQLMQCRLRNTVGEAGYVAGDELMIDAMGSQDQTVSIGVVVVPDATNLNIRYGSAAPVFDLLNKTTGSRTALTPANWVFIIRAWR